MAYSTQERDRASGVGVFRLGVFGCVFFTGLIWFFGSHLDVAFSRDQGAHWYYWKLPQPTFFSRLSAWSLYTLHQIAAWVLIYWGKEIKLTNLKSTTVNYISLGVTGIFAMLHFVQTHIWFDGLAQDVSIWSSMLSVTLLLIWVLILENPRRGLLFGQKISLSSQVMRFAKDYHGYYFAWAITYTFWYHPMVSTPGHLFGFGYTMLLMLQGALFGTKMHTNKYWTALLEILVVVHGLATSCTKAAMQEVPLSWTDPKHLGCMFALGFAAVFVCTQMYGLDLSKRTRTLLLCGYVAAVIYVYTHRGWAKVQEILRIPVANYLGVYLLAAVLSFLASLPPQSLFLFSKGGSRPKEQPSQTLSPGNRSVGVLEEPPSALVFRVVPVRQPEHRPSLAHSSRGASRHWCSAPGA